MTSEATLEKEPQQAGAETTHGPQRQTHWYRPNVDIYELPDELVLQADLPGARGDTVDVHFEDGELTVRAQVDPRQSAGQTYLLREYGVGDYFRTFRVSEQIDASRIVAAFADGVLTLRLPKVEAAKPRKIAVKS